MTVALDGATPGLAFLPSQQYILGVRRYVKPLVRREKRMDTQAVEQFIERLPGDPELRAKYNADPEGTLRELGIDLTDAEVDLVHATDWSAVPDEALGARISMRATGRYET